MLDPGHAGNTYNQSTVIADYYESNMTWTLAAKLKKALEKHGFEVGLTRGTKDEDPELTERGRRARGYDLFLSLHSNASSDPASRSPWLIHFSPDGKTDLDERSEAAARALGPVISQVMGTTAPFYYTKPTDFDRDGNGYVDDEWYGVLFGAKSVGVPGVILEHSFHTNAESTLWLMDEKNLDALAEAEAECLAKLYKTEDEEMTEAEKKAFSELSAKVDKLEKRVTAHHDQIGVKWAYVDENLPDWAAPTVKKLVQSGIIKGNGKNSFELSYLLMRILVMLDRAKIFD